MNTFHFHWTGFTRRGDRTRPKTLKTVKNGLRSSGALKKDPYMIDSCTLNLDGLRYFWSCISSKTLINELWIIFGRLEFYPHSTTSHSTFVCSFRSFTSPSIVSLWVLDLSTGSFHSSIISYRAPFYTSHNSDYFTFIPLYQIIFKSLGNRPNVSRNCSPTNG